MRWRQLLRQSGKLLETGEGAVVPVEPARKLGSFIARQDLIVAPNRQRPETVILTPVRGVSAVMVHAISPVMAEHSGVLSHALTQGLAIQLSQRQAAHAIPTAVLPTNGMRLKTVIAIKQLPQDRQQAHHIRQVGLAVPVI